MCVPSLLFNQLFNYLIHFTTVRRQSPSSNLHYGNNFSGQPWYEINPSILQDEANSRDNVWITRENAKSETYIKKVADNIWVNTINDPIKLTERQDFIVQQLNARLRSAQIYS